MPVVRFPISDDDDATLRRAGIVPARLAEALVKVQARRLRVVHARSLSERYRPKPPQAPASMIREIRDEH